MPPRIPNFGYLNLETCLFYDFSNKSIVALLTFAGDNPKAAGSIPAGQQLFRIACVWVLVILVALP